MTHIGGYIIRLYILMRTLYIHNIWAEYKITHIRFYVFYGDLVTVTNAFYRY